MRLCVRRGVLSSPFQREALFALDVAFLIASTPPTCNSRTKPSPLLDELVLVSALGSMLLANVRPSPLLERGCGRCQAKIGDHTRLDLYDLAVERSETVRLDSSETQAARTCTDGRSIAAWLATELDWTCMLSVPSRLPKASTCWNSKRCWHSLLKRLTREGRVDCWVVVLVDSRVTLGAIRNGKSTSRRVNYLMNQSFVPAAQCGLTWANPADVTSHFRPVQPWYDSLLYKGPQPTITLMAETLAQNLLQIAAKTQRSDALVVAYALAGSVPAHVR